VVTRRVVSWAGLLAPSLLASAVAAQVSTLSPSALVSVSIDDLELKNFYIPGVLLPDGRFKYTLEFTDVSGVVVYINQTVDALSDPQAKITGQTKYTNTSGVPRSVKSQLSFQACPVLPGGTLFGGSVTVLVVTDANGGGVTCAPGSTSVWQATINDTVQHILFACPFQMTKTGSGSLQTSTQFGTPVPSKPGPDDASSFGMNHNLTVTSGEAVTLTTTLVVKSLGLPSGCNADLSFDGMVDGIDLSAVLGNWNQGGWCVEGDVNLNGVVDGDDLGEVLAAWGTCGG